MAPDADSLAATRVLTQLHQSEFVPYQVHPVSSYSALGAIYRAAVGRRRPRALVLVNCGARVDLARILQLGDAHDDDDDDFPVVVLDSRRPYHLANLDHRRVLLLHDSDEFAQQLPLTGFEDEYGYVAPESDSDSDESEEEDESEEDERDRHERQRQRRRRRRRGAATTSPRCSAVTTDSAASLAAARVYYARAWHASPAAGVAYLLAANLNKATADTLWLWIVGLTDQYILRRISGGADTYHGAVKCIRDELARYSPASSPVQPSREMRFDLLRHWTLYESMLRSTFSAARLAVWRQKGERSARELLARLGIPVRESRQQWAHMSAACKEALRTQMPHYAAAYRLDDFMYDSFVRRLGAHHGAVSAADVVLAVTALLDRDEFWRAYDALLCGESSPTVPMQLAVREQRLIVELGGAVIERRRYVPSGPFRYTLLRDLPNVECVASRPLLLTRLALFISEALAAGGARPKPYVLVAVDRARQVNTLVAVGAANEAGDERAQNEFGARFRFVAGMTGAKLACDAFDSTVAELEAGAEQEFIRLLHDIM